MKFKGTKGKWFVGRVILQDGKDSLVVSPVREVKYEKGYRVICNVSPMEYQDDEDLANAQLISKAPEMLKLFKWLLLSNTLSEYDRLTIEQLIKEVTTI